MHGTPRLPPQPGEGPFTGSRDVLVVCSRLTTTAGTQCRVSMVPPQTDGTIYARKLSFIDTNGTTFLSTKPEDWDTDPPQRANGGGVSRRG